MVRDMVVKEETVLLRPTVVEVEEVVVREKVASVVIQQVLPVLAQRVLVVVEWVVLPELVTIPA